VFLGITVLRSTRITYLVYEFLVKDHVLSLDITMTGKSHCIKAIDTPNAAPVGGHYSQAVTFGDFIFISGQLGFKPGTSDLDVGTIEEQIRYCLGNLEQILLAAHSDLNRVIKTTLYISDVEHWPLVNQVYAQVFGEHKPARAIVPCNTLHHGFDVEIEAIATQRR